MDHAIVLENLTKTYSNKRGITDISLEIGRGEIFGFLGPNGAGKTTAMKIMTGLSRADRGRVWLNGFSVTEDFERAVSGVGCMIESVEPFSYMTAAENMRLCGRYYDAVDEDRIDDCLDMVGLARYKNEKIKNYSLGMRQRLGIALALLSHPSIMILDEPLNGLDVEGMVEMRHLIQRLSEEEGTTFFISSHLIHDVELTCNTIGIVYDGRLRSVRKTADVIREYATLENYYLSEVDTDEGA